MTCAAILKGCFKEKPLALAGEVMHFPLSPCGQFAHFSTRGPLLRLLYSRCYMRSAMKKTLDPILETVNRTAFCQYILLETVRKSNDVYATIMVALQEMKKVILIQKPI